MSDKRARFVGHPDGVDLSIPFNDGDTAHLHIAHGGELPSEVNGRRIPAAYRNSLLEQEANWTSVNRATGDEATGKASKTPDSEGK